MNKGAVFALTLTTFAAGGYGGVELSRRLCLPEKNKADELLQQYAAEHDKALLAKEARARHDLEERYRLRHDALVTSHRKSVGELAARMNKDKGQLQQQMKTLKENYDKELARIRTELKDQKILLEGKVKDAETREYETRKMLFGPVNELFRLPEETTFTDLEQRVMVDTATAKDGMKLDSELRKTGNILYDHTNNGTRVLAKKYARNDDRNEYLLLFKMDAEGNVGALYMYSAEMKDGNILFAKTKPYKTIIFTGGKKMLVADHESNKVTRYVKARIVYDGTAGSKTYYENALTMLSQFGTAYAQGTEDPKGETAKPAQPAKKIAPKPERDE